MKKNPKKLLISGNRRSIQLSLDRNAIKLFTDLAEEAMNESRIKVSLHINIKDILKTFILDIYLNLPNETKTNGWSPLFNRLLFYIQIAIYLPLKLET
jgi:hypothetical protein